MILDDLLPRKGPDLQYEDPECHESGLVCGSGLLPHDLFVSRQFPSEHDDGDLGQLAIVSPGEIFPVKGSQDLISKFSSVLKDKMKSFLRTEVQDPIYEWEYLLPDDVILTFDLHNFTFNCGDV